MKSTNQEIENFTLGHGFRTIIDTDFIFVMFTKLVNPFQAIARSMKFSFSLKIAILD